MPPVNLLDKMPYGVAIFFKKTKRLPLSLGFETLAGASSVIHNIRQSIYRGDLVLVIKYGVESKLEVVVKIDQVLYAKITVAHPKYLQQEEEGDGINNDCGESAHAAQ